MFTTEIRKYSAISPGPDSQSHGERYQDSFLNNSDLGVEICSTFLKHTGEKLSVREANFMETSRCFLDCFSAFRKKEIDSSRTLDTYLEEGRDVSISMEEEQSWNLPRSRSPGRRNAQPMSEQLREIQEHCSETCFIVMSAWVAEYKTLQTRVRFYESREALSGRRDEWGSRLEQENLILRKRLEMQQMKMNQLMGEIELLKQKNKSISQYSKEKIGSLQHSHRYFQINNRVYKDIKNYLSEKENLLKQQTQRICEHENQVLRAIQEAFVENACQKCCQILRKLKDSILKFRKYLQGQSEQFEKLYDKYKKTMYSLKSRPSV